MGRGEGPGEDELLALARQNSGGWERAMGLEFVRVSTEEIVAEIEVGDQHLQPFGIVHGGVYSGAIETVCSVGGAMNAAQHDRTVVGAENHTSFLRAVRSGTLHIRATPLYPGRRTQVWEAAVRNDEDRLVASGRVRLICLEQEAKVAGETVPPSY